MSVSKIDQIMADGRYRSKKAIVKVLMAEYAARAEQDVKDWFRVRNTYEDHGLRSKDNGHGNISWKIQPADKRWPGSRFEDITPEEAIRRDTAIKGVSNV